MRLGAGVPRRMALADLVGLLRVAAQAASVLVVARLLGPADFGQYVALTTLLAVAAPLVPLGLDIAVIRLDDGRFATRRTVAVAVGLGLGVSVLAAGVITAVLRQWSAIDMATWLVLVVALSESAHVVVAQHAFRVRSLRGDPLAAAVAFGSPAWVKVLWAAVILAFSLPLPTALVVLACLDVAATGLSAGLLVAALPSRTTPVPVRALLADGVSYAAAFGSRGAVYEVPRVVLSAVATSVSLGLFSVAGRLAQLGLVPATAFMANRAAVVIHRDTSPQALVQILRRSVLLSSLAAVLGIVGIPLIPVLLGEQYADARGIYALLLLWIPVATVSLFVFEVTSLRLPGPASIAHPLAAAALMAASTYVAYGWGGTLAVAGAVVGAECLVAAAGLGYLVRVGALRQKP